MSQHQITALLIRTRDRLLAVPVEHVHEVVPAFEMLRVTGMPPVMAGLIGLRGSVLPVVDTSVLLGQDALELGVHMHFIVLETGHRKFALLFEGVEDLVEIDRVRITRHMQGAGRGPFLGVVAQGENMVLVLDAEACASLEDIARFDGTHDVAVQEGVRS